MHTYLVTFTLNGKRYQEEVRATTGNDAKRLIQNRFSNEKVNIVNVKDLERNSFV